MTACRKYILLTSTALIFGCFSFGQSNSPPKNETIAYEHGLDRPGHDVFLDLDIYSMNADGTNVKALTHDADDDHLPIWSPDGKRIVFIRGFPRSDELYVMDRDGANSHQVRVDPAISSAAGVDGKQVRNPLAITSATWLPNRKLAVTFVGSDASSPTFLLAPDSQDEPRLLFSHAGFPKWSPDGRRIAFAAPDQENGIGLAIYTANADGSMRMQLTDLDLSPGQKLMLSPSPYQYFPEWSPDGRQIAFTASVDGTTGGQIFIISQDGSGVRQATNDPDWGSCRHPSWSPDGQRIAFSCIATRTCVDGVGIGIAGPCIRRIFIISVQNPKPKLIPIIDQDGMDPTFALN